MSSPSAFRMDASGWTIAGIGAVIGGIVGYALLGRLFVVPFVLIGSSLAVGIFWILRDVRRDDEAPGPGDEGS